MTINAFDSLVTIIDHIMTLVLIIIHDNLLVIIWALETTIRNNSKHNTRTRYKWIAGINLIWAPFASINLQVLAVLASSHSRTGTGITIASSARAAKLRWSDVALSPTATISSALNAPRWSWCKARGFTTTRLTTGSTGEERKGEKGWGARRSFRCGIRRSGFRCMP